MDANFERETEECANKLLIEMRSMQATMVVVEAGAVIAGEQKGFPFTVILIII